MFPPRHYLRLAPVWRVNHRFQEIDRGLVGRPLASVRLRRGHARSSLSERIHCGREQETMNSSQQRAFTATEVIEKTEGLRGQQETWYRFGGS